MRQRVVLVAAAVLVAILVAWWLRSRGGSSPPPGHAAATPPAAGPAGGAAARTATDAAPVDDPPPLEGLATGAPDPTERMRPPDAPPIELPPDTQLLAEEFVPGTTEWEEVPVLEGDDRRLRILPVRYNVVAPDPIVVQLELIDGHGGRLPLPGAGVRIRQVTQADGWIELPIADDGRGADAVADDHLYTARLVPDGAQHRALLGQVLVEGRGELPGAGVRRVPTALLYTDGPAAALTGRWRDRVEGGHLIVEAEVDATTAGTFTLNAQLVGPAREPLLWLRTTGDLPAGRGWLTLRGWGKALHDLGVDGPYQVRNALLVRELRGDPDYAPGRTVLAAHTTAPYRAAEFSTEVWVDPGPQGPQVGPDDPSQVGKPPPLGSRVQTP